MSLVKVALILLVTSSISSGKKKVIIDTDAGGDDAIAIITLLRLESDIEVIAFTTACGNANATQAAINVLKTLRVLNNCKIPVHRGCESYYTTSTDLQDDLFGKDAFGDFQFPNPPTVADIREEHGVLTLLRLTQQYPGQITLICIGPLTNIAHAIKIDPNFVKNIDQLIVMGGTYRGVGNESPGTEFNMRRDPDAAALVFENSDWNHPVNLVPWELCLNARITKEWRIKDLGSISSPLMEFMNKVERVELATPSPRWCAPDSFAALLLIRPEFITTTETAQVHVCTEGNLGRGVMLLDRRGEKEVNTKVVIGINVDLYKKILRIAFRA